MSGLLGTYSDPGLAATTGFEDELHQQAAIRQQAVNAQIAAQKAQDEHDLGQQKLAELRQKNAFEAQDRKDAKTKRLIDAMQPGDIPPADLIDDAKQAGIPLKIAPPPTPASAVEGPGPEAPPALQSNDDAAAAAVAPAPPAPPADAQASPDMAGGASAQLADGSMAPPGSVRMAPPPPPAGISTGYGTGTYAGSPQFQAAQKVKADQLAYAESLPEGPEREAARFEANFPGKTPPAGMFRVAKPGSPDMEEVYRQNPSNGTIEKVGEVPKGSHFMTEPKPVDGATTELKTQAAFQRQYNKVHDNLVKMAKPAASVIDSLDRLDPVMGQMTQQADKMIAPLLYRAYVSGEGSGFRMTQQGINALQSAGTTWEKLEASIRSLSLNPEKGLELDDHQRAGMRALARIARTEAERKVNLIDDANSAMLNAKTPHELDQIEADLRKQFTPTSATKKDATPAPTLDDWRAKAGLK